MKSAWTLQQRFFGEYPDQFFFSSIPVGWHLRHAGKVPLHIISLPSRTYLKGLK